MIAGGRERGGHKISSKSTKERWKVHLDILKRVSYEVPFILLRPFLRMVHIKKKKAKKLTALQTLASVNHHRSSD